MSQAMSGLEAKLRAGGFAVTAETTPPLSAATDAVLERAGPLKGMVDAVNVTDGAGARAHLSSHVAAQALVEAGVEPVLQFTGRDRNKLALERDLLGAAAVGIHNILCLGGDPVDKGDEPQATAVNDVDSAGLAALAAMLRDQGRLPSGREIAPPPHYFIGVADTPVDPREGWRPDGLIRKLDAGAQFVQTQFCFDPALFQRYITALAAHGVCERAYVLAGIGALASARQATWIRDNLPGSVVPDAVIDRLAAAADQVAEGIAICAELIAAFRAMAGVAGVHLMGPGIEGRAAATLASMSASS